MVVALTAHASQVETWADERRLTINYLPQKSNSTLFTPETRQSSIHPHVTLNSSPLPLEKRHRKLGVIFDIHFNFTEHINTIITRASSRINILKALAGINWGQQKETIHIII